MIYRDIVNAINFTDCIFQFFSTVRTVNICKFCFTLNKFGIFVRFIVMMFVTTTAFFTMFVVMIVTATAFFTVIVVMIVAATAFFTVFVVVFVTATTFFAVIVMMFVTTTAFLTVFVMMIVTATTFLTVIVVMIVTATAFFAMFVMMFFCLPRFLTIAQNSVRLNLVDNSLYFAYHLVIFCIITVKYKFFSHKIDGNIAETVNFCNVPFKICGTVCTVNACDR